MTEIQEWKIFRSVKAALIAWYTVAYLQHNWRMVRENLNMSVCHIVYSWVMTWWWSALCDYLPKHTAVNNRAITTWKRNMLVPTCRISTPVFTYVVPLSSFLLGHSICLSLVPCILFFPQKDLFSWLVTEFITPYCAIVLRLIAPCRALLQARLIAFACPDRDPPQGEDFIF